MFGYSSVNETPSAVSAEEESSARRPKRSTKKVQQVRRSILEYKSFILYKFLPYSEMVQCICIMALPFVSSFNGKKKLFLYVLMFWLAWCCDDDAGGANVVGGFGIQQQVQQFDPEMTDSSSQSDDTSGCGGATSARTSRGRSATNSRRRKGQLNAKERNLRRLESNERERMRMHSLNDAFQVTSTTNMCCTTMFNRSTLQSPDSIEYQIVAMAIKRFGSFRKCGSIFV